MTTEADFDDAYFAHVEECRACWPFGLGQCAEADRLRRRMEHTLIGAPTKRQHEKPPPAPPAAPNPEDPDPKTE